MKWNITENAESKCPGFSVDILPDEIPAKLHVLVRDDSFYLLANDIVGIISCKKGNSIVIEPKYKYLHPSEMYFYINNLALGQNTTEITQGSEDNTDISALARQFATELISIRCKQRKIKRLPAKHTGAVLKGRVDWVSSARLQAEGHQESICTTTLTSSTDILENQIISLAASSVINFFEPYSLEWNILQSWAALSYSHPLTASKLQKLQGEFKNNQFSGAHGYYYRPLVLALIILGIDQSGMVTSEENAILFNMPGLYEDYIRTAFMRKSAKKGFSCQKSFVPRSFLFCNGNCELEPDITIYDGERVKAVLDVKYKTPDSKDYYQIFTYMKFAALNRVYIISPAVNHMETITSYDGSKIICLRIDSSNHQALEAVAEDIVNAI